MSTSKHTPGPWAVNPFAAQVDAFNRVDGGVTICLLLWPTAKRSEAETAANGNLISAAPELLQELKNARRYIVVHRNELGEVINDDAVTDLERIDAAIAKAEGQS